MSLNLCPIYHYCDKQKRNVQRNELSDFWSENNQTPQVKNSMLLQSICFFENSGLDCQICRSNNSNYGKFWGITMKMAKTLCKGFPDNNWNVLNVIGNRIPYSKLPETSADFIPLLITFLSLFTLKLALLDLHSRLLFWPQMEKTLVLQLLRTSCNTSSKAK